MVLLKHINIQNHMKCFLTQAVNWLCTVQQCISYYIDCHRKEVNMTSNQIAYLKAKIEEAHYGRADTEQARSDKANEALTAMKIENENAHYLRSDAETVRSNQAKERENYRSNVAKESENYRTNLANENILWSQVAAMNAERYSNVAKNYADASLKEAQTSGELYKARANESQSRYLQEMAETERKRQDLIGAQTYDVYWQEELQNYKAAEYTLWKPFEVWADMVSSLGGLGRGLGAVSNLGGSNYGQKQSSKQQQTYYKDGITYTNTWYTSE